MVMGMGFGDFDLNKIAGGNLGLGNFGQLTGANEQGSAGSIFGNKEEAEAGDSFTSSGMMGGFDITNMMGGMPGMSGMSGMMGGMPGMSGMPGMMGGMSGLMGGTNDSEGISGIMGGFDMSGMSGMMNGTSGMTGMMGGMFGGTNGESGGFQELMTGFLELVGQFIQGLIELLGGGSTEGEADGEASDKDAQTALSDPETYWNEQADLTGEAVNSIKDEENIKENTTPEAEGELADKDEELKAFIGEYGAVDITEEASSPEQAVANAEAMENLYKASQSAEAIRKHFGEDLTDEQVAQIGAEIRSYIEKVAPNTGDVSFDGDSENNFLLTEDNEMNPDYE